jgi:lipooligosaccharide transport system permease protein
MWKRDALLYKRSWKRNVLPNFFEPLLYLFSIGLGLGVYVGRKILGVDYADFIAPGLAAAAAMNGAVFETTFNVFVKLRFAKLYDAVITTPLEPEDVAAGELLWAVTRSTIYGVAFVLVMAALGYVHYWAVVFAPLAVALIGLSFGLIGLVFTALTPTIDLFSYFFTLFITPLFLFNGRAGRLVLAAPPRGRADAGTDPDREPRLRGRPCPLAPAFLRAHLSAGNQPHASATRELSPYRTATKA